MIGGGDDLLAAGLEIDDGLADILELGQAGAAEGREIEDQNLDPVVVLGRFDGVDDVLEQGFGRRRTPRLIDHLLDGFGGELLDELPLGGDDQGRRVGDLGIVAC